MNPVRLLLCVRLPMHAAARPSGEAVRPRIATADATRRVYYQRRRQDSQDRDRTGDVMRLVAGSALLLLVAWTEAWADWIEVPLTVDHGYLTLQVGEALELGPGADRVLVYDECGSVRISDPAVTSVDRELMVELSIDAELAAGVLGQCVSLGGWQGRVGVRVLPEVHESGRELRFRPEEAAILRADGSEAALTGASRVLAEAVILPRVGEVRVDLRQPLEALDDLLDALLGPGREAVGTLAPSRLREATVVDEGLRVTVLLDPGEQIPVTRESPVDPLTPGELEEWQRLEDELDGFLTHIIVALAEASGNEAVRRELAGVLLDARWAIAEALAADDPGPDPVRRLFVEAWDRLRPHLRLLDDADLPMDTSGLRFAGFLAGGDAIRALDELGPRYGVEITREGLRRLARMLLSDAAPDRFTPLPLGVDPRIRALFPLSGQPAEEGRAPRQGPLLGWLLPAANAGDSPPSPASRLEGKVPRLANLDEYLGLVSALMDREIHLRHGGDSRMPAVFRHMLDPLVRATAWKESCWRQYTGPTSAPRVLTSSVGALGMMQIHARVWRGVYDLDRLAGDVTYNLNAGIDILEYYFVDYALRRGEHEQAGGLDNLVRATYAAYNGGPGHLTRYRNADTPARLRAIDRDFWHHYETMRSRGWPDVASCYPVG